MAVACVDSRPDRRPAKKMQVPGTTALFGRLELRRRRNPPPQRPRPSSSAPPPPGGALFFCAPFTGPCAGEPSGVDAGYLLACSVLPFSGGCEGDGSSRRPGGPLAGGASYVVVPVAGIEPATFGLQSLGRAHRRRHGEPQKSWRSCPRGLARPRFLCRALCRPLLCRARKGGVWQRHLVCRRPEGCGERNPSVSWLSSLPPSDDDPPPPRPRFTRTSLPQARTDDNVVSLKRRAG